MTYPVAQVVMPTDLKSAKNGQLPAQIMRSVKPNEQWQMHHLAARAWEALRAAAWRDGIQLSVSGNPYRSYDQQSSLFNQRYTKTYSAGINTLDDQRTWNGVKYYKRLGVAAVATPGTSNHGWGLAVDTAIDADGDLEFEWPPKSLHSGALNWLLTNASKYGFSWEIQSEPWHIRYVTGDTLPAAVMAYESASKPFDPAKGQWGTWPSKKKPNTKIGSTGDHVKYLKGVLKLKAGQDVNLNGIFSIGTSKAVKNVQKFFKLQVDGNVGPETWKVIDWLATS